MKLKEIEIGQIVVDKFGNEYVVEQVQRHADLMPVLLKCTKFVKSIGIQESDITFDDVDESFWIYKSKKIAKNDGMSQENCVTVKSLKLKGESK